MTIRITNFPSSSVWVRCTRPLAFTRLSKFPIELIESRGVTDAHEGWNRKHTRPKGTGAINSKSGLRRIRSASSWASAT